MMQDKEDRTDKPQGRHEHHNSVSSIQEMTESVRISHGAFSNTLANDKSPIEPVIETKVKKA